MSCFSLKISVCCSVLQCVAVCFRVLQRGGNLKFVLICNELLHEGSIRPCHTPPRITQLERLRVAVCCSAFQCVAVCCSVMQCVAVCLQCFAVCCSVFATCVAVCCSVLQCVAV